MQELVKELEKLKLCPPPILDKIGEIEIINLIVDKSKINEVKSIVKKHKLRAMTIFSYDDNVDMFIAKTEEHLQFINNLKCESCTAILELDEVLTSTGEIYTKNFKVQTCLNCSCVICKQVTSTNTKYKVCNDCAYELHKKESN